MIAKIDQESDSLIIVTPYWLQNKLDVFSIDVIILHTGIKSAVRYVCGML